MELDQIRFDEKGLVPAIAQDVRTGQVLMLAYMNRESLEETLRSGYATYFSRSRQQLWKKGETSGHVQKVLEIRYDCDEDALLLKVEQCRPVPMCWKKCTPPSVTAASIRGREAIPIISWTRAWRRLRRKWAKKPVKPSLQR